eukprot:gene33024-42723_t
MDGSSCCFNFFCLPVIPYRWIVRSAYGIGDTTSFWEDCILCILCPCCSTNQLYQTTTTKGNPTTDGGSRFNTASFSSNARCTCFPCLYTCCCMCCVVGDTLQTAYGMPWLLGCCCVNPFFARNTIRYHYRLKTTTDSNECIEECAIPYIFYCCVNLVASAIPILSPIAYCQWIALVMIVMNMQEEVSIKSLVDVEGDRIARRKAYLVGYSTQSSVPITEGVVIAEPKGDYNYSAVDSRDL